MDKYSRIVDQQNPAQYMDQHLNNPSITVFLAVYNGEEYLADAIQSVLDQTFTDFELLIIDDGSTDNSSSIAKSFKDSRIRLLTNIKNKGLVYTRNRGLKEARGEYLAILDSDDISLVNRLAVQYKFMCAHPEIAMCGSHAVVINSKGDDIKKDIRVITGNYDLGMHMIFGNIFVNSSLMLRKHIITEAGGYHAFALAEDYDLAVRISCKYQVANINEILVKYRVHDNNISGRIEEMGFYVKKVIAQMHQYLGIALDDKLIDTHYSILSFDEKFEPVDIVKLLRTLKLANLHVQKYNIKKFNRLLLQHLYDILIFRKEKNWYKFYFSKPLFDWRVAGLKQIRRGLKLYVKNWLKIS